MSFACGLATIDLFHKRSQGGVYQFELCLAMRWEFARSPRTKPFCLDGSGTIVIRQSMWEAVQ